MSNLFSVPLLLALVAFVVGLFAAKFAAYVGARAAGLEIPRHDHTIRALEANLRVARKDTEKTTEKLHTSTQKLDALSTSVNEMEQTLQFRQEELDTMRDAVKSESKKVIELRRTLTERAEETIRAKASARDSETELSLLKAGTATLFDDADYIEAEREELTNRLKALDEKIAEEPAVDQCEADEAAQDDLPADQYLSDC